MCLCRSLRRSLRGPYTFSARRTAEFFSLCALTSLGLNVLSLHSFVVLPLAAAGLFGIAAVVHLLAGHDDDGNVTMMLGSAFAWFLQRNAAGSDSLSSSAGLHILALVLEVMLVEILNNYSPPRRPARSQEKHVKRRKRQERPGGTETPGSHETPDLLPDGDTSPCSSRCPEDNESPCSARLSEDNEHPCSDASSFGAKQEPGVASADEVSPSSESPCGTMLERPTDAEEKSSAIRRARPTETAGGRHAREIS